MKGINLPKVVLGTSSLGNLYIALPDDVKQRIVEAYINAPRDNALPVIDTAGKYGAGLALESISKSLKLLNVNPDKVVVSNKLGWLRVPLLTAEPTFEPGVWKDLKHDAVQKISYDGILECYEQGNRLLGDYPSQFVSVHDPDEYLAAAADKTEEDKRYLDILAAYSALNELRRSAKVSAIGVGAKDWKIIARISRDVNLDWVMIANCMTINNHPKPLMEFMKQLERQGTMIINAAVFNGGFLTGGSHYNYKLVDSITPAGKKLHQWRQRFYQVCKEFNILPALAGIKFGLSAPGVTGIALSADSADLLKANIALTDLVVPNVFWQQLYSETLISAEGLEMVIGYNNQP